jgi:methyl-accepting chemotaxis protein
VAISTKIYLVILIPTLALIGLATWILRERWSEVADARATLEAQVALRAVSRLVADLQLERGRSAQFIGARGAKFGDDLREQRARVDESAALIKGSLDADARASLGDEASELIADGEKALAALPQLRRQVSDLSIRGSASTDAYSADIRFWLDATEALARSTGVSQTKNHAIALSELQAAAEAVGRMRALGAGGLAGGKFELATLEGIAALAGSEKENARRAAAFAPPSARGSLARLDSPEAHDFERMRATILASDPGTAPPGLTSDAWFAAATRQVNVYGAASEETLAALRDESEALLGASNRTAHLTLAGLFAFVIGVIVFGLYLARSITRPLAAIGACLGRLSSGDLEAEVPEVGRSADVATLAEATRRFKQASRDRVQLEQETASRRAEVEAERARAALDAARVAREQADVVERLGAALSKLADRDLTARLPDNFPPAYAKLMGNFNHAIAAVEMALRRVRSSVETITSGAREIASASDDLSQRTETQAANLEESAAAVHDLSSVVDQTAGASTRTKDIISEAKSDASGSVDTVRRAVEAMTQIMSSSEKIGAIIGVIDEIAFQTNLLALNAGVEAARAGEAGRGFAVVASEVRGLAQRSTEAAKEIKDLISNSAAQVSSGVELVNATGRAFDRINKQVSVIDGGIADIAGQALDQSSRLKQLNAAIGQLDQATQQNAAMAEQATAACRSLEQESLRLDAMVAEFTLRAEGWSDRGSHSRSLEERAAA